MSAVLATLAPPPPAHPECTSVRHDWIGPAFERNAAWKECENRPWANLTHGAASGCVGQDFVLHNPRVHMRFFWNEAESLLAGVVHWGHDSEGPPKGAHGASIAMVFDEILAYPVWRSGLGAFTANLNINLRRMVPHMSTLRFRGRVASKNGRKIVTEGAITSPDESIVYADCKGLWIESAYMGDTQGKAVEAQKAKEKQVALAKL